MDRYTHLSDRELLAVVADDVAEMRRAMWGNGRPGLMERMATLEERTPQRVKDKVWLNGDLTRLSAILGTAVGGGVLVALQTIL